VVIVAAPLACPTVPAPVAAMVSFRLGGPDGVSIEAAKWAGALEELGFRIRTVAGDGPVDHVVPGLAIDASTPPSGSEVLEALAGTDLVVVENLCSLPLNPGAAEVVATCLRGRRALLHHHDLPWQRARFAGAPPPPDDPEWVHVTTTELSRRELRARGIASTTVYNAFDTDVVGDRALGRAAIGVAPDELLAVQPTRAIERKNVPEGLALATAIGATYWLLGPAEEGYGPVLEALLADARTPVLHGHGRGGVLALADVYAASDVVLLPSRWEGFGNPSVESAVHRRPLAVGRYPVAEELAKLGFRWFPSDEAAPLSGFLEAPDPLLIADNAAVAARHFALRDLPGRIGALFAQAGWDDW
jgi:mannosylglucosylglycerate synthase